MERRTVDESYKIIIEAFNNGDAIEEIAKKAGLSKSTIRTYIWYLRKDGKLPPYKRARFSKEESDEQNKQIIELYNQGMPYREIAENLGISKGILQGRITKLISLGKLKRRPRIDPELLEEIIKQYNGGISTKEMAINLNTTEAAVRYHILKLRKAGELKKRPRTTYKNTKPREQKVATMYNQGFSVKEIANNLEISESTIRRDIEKLVSSGEIVKRPKSNVKKTENKPKLKEKRGIEDPKLRKKVVGLVQKGYSTKQMAKRLGVSRASVCNYIKRLKEDGLIPYADREVATSEQLERENKQIVQWYRQAVPAKEIADNLG